MAVLFPITAYDETTKKLKANVTRAQQLPGDGGRGVKRGRGCWACLEGSWPKVAMVQSVDEFLISARTRRKRSYVLESKGNTGLFSLA